MGDLYAVLGVKRTATSNEIKSAYRRLARRYHPDVNADPAAQLTFSRINEAYHTLIDSERRKAYDLTGSVSSTARATYSSAASRDARRAHFQERADRIVNEWLRREREETRARGKAVYTTVTLFFSSFLAAITAGQFPLTGAINESWGWLLLRVLLLLAFIIGVRHLFNSLKEHFDYYTYRPPRVSAPRPIRNPNRRFKRSDAMAFVVIGYLFSVGAGVLIRLLFESHSPKPMEDNIIITSAILYALIYPPIAVLIVDKIYSITQSA
ncbi:MAG TPA: J domain-containing protein [Blastocatellia bacterium]